MGDPSCQWLYLGLRYISKETMHFTGSVKCSGYHWSLSKVLHNSVLLDLRHTFFTVGIADIYVIWFGQQETRLFLTYY